MDKHDGDRIHARRHPAMTNANAEGDNAGQLSQLHHQHAQTQNHQQLNLEDANNNANHDLNMNPLAFDQWNMNMNITMPGLGMSADAFNMYSFGNNDAVADGWQHHGGQQ